MSKVSTYQPTDRQEMRDALRAEMVQALKKSFKYDKYEKILFSKLFIKYRQKTRQDGKSLSIDETKSLAYNDMEYKDFIDNAVIAKGEYLELKERYENFKDDMKAEGIEKYKESKVLNDTV